MNFSLYEISKFIEGSYVIGDDKVIFNKISINSKKIKPGNLFIALQGSNLDGHNFLSEVIKKQANAVVISKKINNLSIPSVYVQDTKIGFQIIAHNWRKKFTIPIIAVSGSNGKTTVKEMITSIFKEETNSNFRYLSSFKNFNNFIGVPITLCKLNKDHIFAVIEIGINHPGETKILSNIIKPTIAVINNAQREHYKFMKNLKTIAIEHSNLIHSLDQNGIVIYPSNDIYSNIWKDAAKNRKIISFVLQINEYIPATVVGKLFNNILNITTPIGSIIVRLKTLGLHNAHNALAATSAALANNISLNTIKHGLEKFNPIDGRLKIKYSKFYNLVGSMIIDDTYNSNIDSVIAAIDVLSKYKSPKILILGDMAETGDNKVKFYYEIGLYAKKSKIDLLYTLGESSYNAGNAYGFGAYHSFYISSIIKQLKKNNFGNSATILVKGSRFMKMERIINILTN